MHISNFIIEVIGRSLLVFILAAIFRQGCPNIFLTHSPDLYLYVFAAISGIEVILLVSKTLPVALASIIGIPKPSYKEGKLTMSHSWYNLMIF